MNDQDQSQLLEGQPPGTIFLQHDGHQNRAEIILHPTPSNDPNQPLNWPLWYKIWNFVIVLFYILNIAAATDIGTVIYGDQMDELGITFSEQNVAFGLNTAGLAVGVVLEMPLVLKYGRKPVFIISLLTSLVSTVWQAKMMTSLDLILTSLVSGLGGAISEAICQVSIADTFFTHQLGAANAAYLMTVEMGGFLAPVVAGYAAHNQGWRWIWWWMTILIATNFLFTVFGYEDTKWTPASETMTPALPESRTSTEVPPQKDCGYDVTESKPVEVQKPIQMEHGTVSLSRKKYWQKMSFWTITPGAWGSFARHIWQPFYIAVMFPAVTYSVVQFASVGAWFSLIVSIYSQQFTLPPYNFTAEGVGLMNLAPFVGSLIGAVYGGVLLDKSALWLSRRNNGIFEPEMRLWIALPAIVTMPAALLIFGLGTANGLPWIVPASGAALFGFSFAALGDVALTYSMDCYGAVSKRVVDDCPHSSLIC